MKEIVLKGVCGDRQMRYKLERPLMDMKLWQIRVNGDAVGSIFKARDGQWYARCGADTGISGFEILTFIEMIEST